MNKPLSGYTDREVGEVYSRSRKAGVPRGDFSSATLHHLAKAVSATDKYILARKAAPRMQVPNHPEAPVIVSNIPVPGEARGGPHKFDHYYPFEDMKPGDSFWVPSSTYCTAEAVTKFAKKSGWKFTSRGQTEDGRKNILASKCVRGTRVWRTA